MKKLLLAFALLATVAFVGCDKSDDNEMESSTSSYTLSISPSTAKIGDTVTLTVTGDDVDDYSWQACYSSTSNSANSGCWAPNTSSTWTYTVALDAGEYEIYATSMSGDHSTNKSTFTVTQ